MPWISTYTGKRINPLAPDPDQICIEDIAHALSQLCRWTGHTRRFYSVAQHSVLVSGLSNPGHKLIGLLHDAPEAYITDLNRPLKNSTYMSGYRLVEQLLWNAIVEKFDLINIKIPQDVKKADDILMNTEARDLLPDSSWIDADQTLEEHIDPMSPVQAEAAFLLQYQVRTSQPVFDRYIKSTSFIDDNFRVELIEKSFSHYPISQKMEALK